MNNILEQAQAIKNDIVEYRRTIHENPEVGDTLPKTKAYVMDKLRELGYEPKYDVEALFRNYKEEMEINRFRELRGE